MATQISPTLDVSDGAQAIEFYMNAFAATELWRILDLSSPWVARLVDEASLTCEMEERYDAPKPARGKR